MDAEKKTCFECVFSEQHDGGTFCLMFDEPIDSELYAASHCGEYTRG